MFNLVLRLLVCVLILSFMGLSPGRATGGVPGPHGILEFERGQHALADTAKDKLDEILRRARAIGIENISEIQVAVWGDLPMPRVGEEPSKTDRELAERRIDQLRSYITRYIHGVTITAFDLAERSSWLARIFDTKEAELKAQLSKEDDQPLSKEEFRIYKENGDVSRAVILVMLKRR